MVIETTKNQITLNRIVGQKKENRLIESDIIVNDIKPDVLSVISTSGIVNIYKKEIMDGKVRLDGAINTYIIYLADDENGSTRTLNTSMDFTQIIDIENCTDKMKSEENIVIKNFDTKVINGRKLNIKANIETTISIYSNESFDIITDVQTKDNIQILNNNQIISTLVGSGNNRVIVKDTIAIDPIDDFAEIMKVNFNIIDEETKISYNKVLSKADAIIEIMYLTEDNRINNVATKIPIMGFVDMPNISEECECKVKNILTNLIIKPNSIDEHSIYIEAEIEINCNAYETKDINIIEDLYSITDNIEFTKRDVNIITERNLLSDMYSINENIRIPELVGKVFDVQVNVDINDTQIRNSKVTYGGNLNLEILLESNGGIITKNVDFPFNFEVISDKIDKNSIINTEVKIKQNDFFVKDGTIEMAVSIEFITYEQKSEALSIIEQIKTYENKECSNYSMIIYFVKPGDTIWKIAKMFRSTVSDIARINEIEDENKINVGQQLYIPKFCKNNI